MLVFEERGKPEFPEKNLSEQSREPTNSAHIWRRVRESNPGHIGGRRALSPLHQPCSSFSIHTGPAPSLTPQTMLEACIQNFFRVSTLYRVGEGRTARKFRKGCTVLKGNREMTEKYEYCSTVLRTFVQDCSSNNVWMNSVDYSSSVIWIPQKTSLSR